MDKYNLGSFRIFEKAAYAYGAEMGTEQMKAEQRCKDFTNWSTTKAKVNERKIGYKENTIKYNYVPFLKGTKGGIGFSLEERIRLDLPENLFETTDIDALNKLYSATKSASPDGDHSASIKLYIRFLEDGFENKDELCLDEEPPLNQILYGPPGTGKTYSTVKIAVEICDPDFYNEASDYKTLFEKYNELVDQGRIVFTTFHQSFGYEDFIEGIRPDLDSDSGSLSYKLEPGIFKKLCDTAKESSEENYVIVIDEINRGNISRIFGELITLLEESKRLGAKEERQTCLPYSRESFGVPSNVYVLGTMNTADRSLTQLDTALRRRFDFVEMPPNPSLLDSANSPTGVDLQKLLEAINARIVELYDREHRIGHSYLMGLESFEDLKTTFGKKIIPLLQEYFYDDYSKIQQVLNKDFIAGGEDGARSFRIKESEDWKLDSFTSIYRPIQDDNPE